MTQAPERQGCPALKVTFQICRNLLARSAEVEGPEANLVVSVLALAIWDCRPSARPVAMRNEARRFIADGLADGWCDLLGIRSDWPLEIATKLGFMEERSQQT